MREFCCFQFISTNLCSVPYKFCGMSTVLLSSKDTFFQHLLQIRHKYLPLIKPISHLFYIMNAMHCFHNNAYIPAHIQKKN